MAGSGASCSSPMTQAGPRPFQGTTSRAGVPREGTCFRDSRRTMRRFNPVLPVGDIEDAVTSMTAQSSNQDCA
jgi:hypothetical protein